MSVGGGLTILAYLGVQKGCTSHCIVVRDGTGHILSEESAILRHVKRDECRADVEGAYTSTGEDNYIPDSMRLFLRRYGSGGGSRGIGFGRETL